jgi:hypothetical protein
MAGGLHPAAREPPPVVPAPAEPQRAAVGRSPGRSWPESPPVAPLTYPKRIEAPLPIRLWLAPLRTASRRGRTHCSDRSTLGRNAPDALRRRRQGATASSTGLMPCSGRRIRRRHSTLPRQGKARQPSGSRWGAQILRTPASASPAPGQPWAPICRAARGRRPPQPSTRCSGRAAASPRATPSRGTTSLRRRSSWSSRRWRRVPASADRTGSPAWVSRSSSHAS